jgi:hypothetical protein
MKRILSSALTAVLFLSLGRAYAQFDTPSAGFALDPAAAAGIPTPSTPRTKVIVKSGWQVHRPINPLTPKEWTVMVFVNAKNDLELAGLYNVNEMEKVGSTGDVNIVVEMGRMKGQENDIDTDGDWTGARRYRIEKDTDTMSIRSPVLMSAAYIDLGDYKQASDFVKWSKLNFPARHYMFIIWNHGTGFMDVGSVQKGISIDSETGNYIRTPQIGLILKEAGEVDVLAFDACLMQMSEIAFEVKDRTKVVIGSQEVIPALGYPYRLFLDALTSSPGMNADEVGAVAVDAFKIFYDLVKRGAHLSAIRTSKLDGLAARISEFTRLAREIGDTRALKAARNGVIRYNVFDKLDPDMKVSFYGDLSQFARLVSANLKKNHARLAEFKAKSAELREYIDKELVINNKASLYNLVGRDLSESGGISVYLPPVDTRFIQDKLESIFEYNYTDFAFDKATGWHDFVTYLYGIK